jgi:threonine aldolase
MAFPDGVADFRSDTVTRPTAAMRRAMAEAEVGDDVYGEDPTVNALEEESAAAVGKAAAVFVPTGTMGNQLSIMAQTRPGEEVLCDEGAHCRNVERGASAALSGVAFRTVHAPGGWIQPHQIEVALGTAGVFYPRIGLMVWENTHNLSGGRVIPVEGMEAGNSEARRHGLAIHLDGARLFNAAVALGVGADQLAAGVDTVTFCFSKGLGAPVGSIICGSPELMAEIRYLRKRLGGGMRQVGVIAAAARVALRDWERLEQDHLLAARLAAGIADHAPSAVDPASVETNIVNVVVDHLKRPWPEIAARLATAAVAVNAPINGVWRLVTHRDVDASDVDRLVAAISR